MLPLVVVLTLIVSPNLISGEEEQLRYDLNAFKYVCIDATLSTDLPDPFTTALNVGDGSLDGLGVEISSEKGKYEYMRHSSVADVLMANGAPELPDAITILKNGTLCFRGGVRDNTGIDSGRRKSLNLVDGANDGGRGKVQGRKLKGEENENRDGDAEVELVDEKDVRVDPKMSSRFPFAAVGALENGCTGSFIGRCHVLTAGHCVLHPREFKMSKELKFTPGMNGNRSEAPYGTFDFIDVKVARRWGIFSDPAHDFALVHIKDSGEMVDNQFGYLHIGDGGGSDRLSNLNIAGYPEDKKSGQMWYDFCKEIPFAYSKRRFINHSCRVEKGNSGSPMWVYNNKSGVRQTRALHVAELTYGRRLPDDRAEIIASSPQAVILSGVVLEEINMWMKEMPCS